MMLNHYLTSYYYLIIEGIWGGMFHVKHEQQFDKRQGLYQFHPIPPNQNYPPPNSTQPSKMAQPSHFQPITPLIILLLFTLIKHHLFVINLSTITNSYLSTLNINFLLYITKFISLSTSLLLINYYVQQGRGGVDKPNCVKSIECYIEQTL